jgi:cytoskeleton protein RodZ
MADRAHIADLIRSAREERGLSVEQAASEAGVPPRYARLLEGERLAVGIPDDFYLVPFFRRYAGFVGLDVPRLLPDFLGHVQHVPSEPAPRVQISYRPAIADLWKPAAAVLAIALAAGLLMRSGPSQPTEYAAERVAVDTAPAETDEPARVAAVAQTDDDAVAGDDAAGAASELQGSLMPAAQSPSGMKELQVTAKEETWLSIGLDDQPAKEFLLQPGETHTWTASAVFRLKVGNAGGITLVLDGRDLPALGESGQVVRLDLPESPPSG